MLRGLNESRQHSPTPFGVHDAVNPKFRLKLCDLGLDQHVVESNLFQKATSCYIVQVYVCICIYVHLVNILIYISTHVCVSRFPVT